MVDAITANENLVIKQGDTKTKTPPPASSEVSESGSRGSVAQKGGDAGSQVELSPTVKETLESDQQDRQDKLLETELNDTIGRLNDKLEGLNREILLKTDNRSGQNYVSVIDKGSQEVIREFPPEEVRTFIARFMEFNENLASNTDIRSLIINLEV
jgi:uncharacterized FlaG/YvyC family protein